MTAITTSPAIAPSTPQGELPAAPVPPWQRLARNAAVVACAVFVNSAIALAAAGACAAAIVAAPALVPWVASTAIPAALLAMVCFSDWIRGKIACVTDGPAGTPAAASSASDPLSNDQDDAASSYDDILDDDGIAALLEEQSQCQEVDLAHFCIGYTDGASCLAGCFRADELQSHFTAAARQLFDDWLARCRRPVTVSDVCATNGPVLMWYAPSLQACLTQNKPAVAALEQAYRRAVKDGRYSNDAAGRHRFALAALRQPRSSRKVITLEQFSQILEGLGPHCQSIRIPIATTQTDQHLGQTSQAYGFTQHHPTKMSTLTRA